MDEDQYDRAKPSEFYYACRSGDIETVGRYLAEQTLESLDHIEPNKSTALHAATYYKHPEIVRLLLERGFTRRVMNSFDNLPQDEAEDQQTRDLFLRPTASTRFGSDVIDEYEKSKWIVVDHNEHNVHLSHPVDLYKGNRLIYETFRGEKLLEQLGQIPRIEAIRRAFRRAIEEKDSSRLIQALTIDSDLFRLVEIYLISLNSKTENSHSNVMSDFVDTIIFNRQLHEKYQFLGKCYRTIRVRSDQDVAMFKIGSKIINRTFLSATKDRKLAESYVEQRGPGRRYAAIISFDIRHPTSALDIEHLSEFPHEKEILIMNNQIFKVIQFHVKSNFDIEIELRHSKTLHVDPRDNNKGGILSRLNWT